LPLRWPPESRAISGLQGEGGTGKSVLAAAVAHCGCAGATNADRHIAKSDFIPSTANVAPYLTDTISSAQFRRKTLLRALPGSPVSKFS
jgi:predicted ATPase